MKYYAFLLMLGSALMLIPGFPAFAEQVWIEWMPNTEQDFSHYLVYRSTVPLDKPSLLKNLLTSVQTPQYRDAEVKGGETYYYWISALDKYGNESPCSGPLKIYVPPAVSQRSKGELVAFLIQHLDEDFHPNDPFLNPTLDNDATIDFAWNSFTGSDLTYKIYLLTGEYPAELKAEISQNTYRLSNAVNHQKYRLRVDVIGKNQQLQAQGYSEFILCDIKPDTMRRPGKPRSVVMD